MKHKTLIKPRWMLTVNAQFELLENCVLVIEGDTIQAIKPVSELTAAESQGADLVELDNHVLMPGLVNAHTHAAMTLLRGIADDLPLMDWLQNHI